MLKVAEIEHNSGGDSEAMLTMRDPNEDSEVSDEGLVNVGEAVIVADARIALDAEAGALELNGTLIRLVAKPNVEFVEVGSREAMGLDEAEDACLDFGEAISNGPRTCCRVQRGRTDIRDSGRDGSGGCSGIGSCECLFEELEKGSQVRSDDRLGSWLGRGGRASCGVGIGR